jgi:hypothetical protein
VPDQERAVDLARALKMENVVNYAGGTMEQAKASLINRFQGAYKSYYEAQAVSVRISSVKLAELALDKYWLTAPKAPGGWENLDRSKPLNKVIDRMTDYEEAFLLTKDKKTLTGSLRRLLDRSYEQITAQDLDFAIDWFCFLVGWLIRILALLAFATGYGIPAAAVGLLVATSIDYFGAMLRIMLVAVSTMMDVLVIQHDILITEAIAYLVMFKGEPGGSGE